MGAVVGVILIIPALLAFIVDRIVQKKQISILTARSVIYVPKKNKTFDLLMLLYCSFIALIILKLRL